MMKRIKVQVAAAAIVMMTLVLGLPGNGTAKDYKLTVVAGHPPIFLWAPFSKPPRCLCTT